MRIRNILPILVALFLAGSASLGQQPPSGSMLKNLVETEQAFARTSEERGTRDAFLAFIADDGILFRPRAVAGKQWLQDHPTPPSNKRPLLAWQPAVADIAEAGDLGYTTGPWEFKNDIKDEKPSAYGDFVTVWKKQNDGSWKFAVDLGISHPQSSGPLKLWQVDEKPDKSTTRTVDVAAATKSLLDHERKFAAASIADGFLKAFGDYSHPNVRLYREGSLPIVGKDAAMKSLANNRLALSWQPISGDVSRSGDLGYSYGTYEARDPSSSQVSEKGNYLRIWKKQSGSWRVVLEVANPVKE